MPQLLKDENVAVRVESAGHCLALGIHISQAEEVLKNVMINKENGIFRLNAEMTVKQWKEGSLTIIYRK